MIDGLQAGRPGLDRQQWQETFLYSTTSRWVLAPTHPPIQWVPRALFPGVKLLGLKTDHSLPPSAEVKNGRAKLPLPHMFSFLGT
jgi:hypothetical protein